MMPSIRRSVLSLVLLTLLVSLVHSRAVERQQERPCPKSWARIAGDCVPLITVRSLRHALCELSSYMNENNPLSRLNKFCLNEPESTLFKKVFGDRGEDKKIWGNPGYTRIENGEEKRAWWHSGLKPERR